jgi:predicted dehydrogenase
MTNDRDAATTAFDGDPIPTVQIGCGGRGNTHARALTDSDRFDLRAVCDIDADRAETFAEEYDLPAWYTDADTAIETVDPAHVTFVTPPRIRLPLVEQVLVHEPASMLFEKPISNDFGEALTIADRIEASETRVAVCHQHIWGREHRALRGWLDDDRIGDVRRLTATTKGGLSGHGCHLFHKLSWLLDANPTAVRAHCSGTDELDPDDPDVGHVQPTDATVELVYPDGVRAFCHLGPEAPDVPAQADTFHLEFRVDAVGDDGRAGLVLGSHADCVGRDGGDRVDVPGFDTDGYATRGLYDDLAAWVAHGRDFPSDFETAMRAQRVIEAAMRSHLDGTGVDPAAIADGDRDTVAELRARLSSRV